MRTIGIAQSIAVTSIPSTVSDRVSGGQQFSGFRPRRIHESQGDRCSQTRNAVDGCVSEINYFATTRRHLDRSIFR